MLHIDTMSSSEFKDACDRAAAYSAKHECTAHLNAVVRMFTYGMQPRFEVSFIVSDWFSDGQTVATWTNGKRRD
jgi:hypothetical protein